jgi:hypothetical protein
VFYLHTNVAVSSRALGNGRSIGKCDHNTGGAHWRRRCSQHRDAAAFGGANIVEIGDRKRRPEVMRFLIDQEIEELGLGS